MKVLVPASLPFRQVTFVTSPREVLAKFMSPAKISLSVEWPLL
jgi:hypothetical protein